MIADYCEALIHAKMGKGLLTIFEECQDFVPLQKRSLQLLQSSDYVN